MQTAHDFFHFLRARFGAYQDGVASAHDDYVVQAENGGDTGAIVVHDAAGGIDEKHIAARSVAGIIVRPVIGGSGPGADVVPREEAVGNDDIARFFHDCVVYGSCGSNVVQRGNCGRFVRRSR